MSGLFKNFVEQKMGSFPQFLIYAVLEMVMIILLFINGFLSFIANEYARFFELEIPCLLCTRIDHVLVHRNTGFYFNESMCEFHKKDISSLAYCHVHKKLSDIRNMCEGCLLSFATGKDRYSCKYKSLVGILHKDIDTFVDDGRIFMRSGRKDDPFQVENPRCSCCGEPLKIRPSAKFSRNSSMNSGLAPAPSPRAPLLSSWRNDQEARNLDLPHIRYTELKIVSENDSELLEDEGSSTVDNHRKEGVRVATVPILPYSEDLSEEVTKTPISARNRFFGISLSDSTQASPRYRTAVRKMSIDRADFFSEPNDPNAPNEGDSESSLQNSKKQVRVDQKSLLALFMELDEERSASAVAANNAMAMITRLQAEKAAVQMEALQYQRMMEEQAEYDQEAMQVLKDLILKREEEIGVLETELEVYKEKYGRIKKIGSDVCEVDDDDYQGLRSQTVSEGSSSSSNSSEDQNAAKDSLEGSVELGSLDESFLDFENERSYLLNMLTDIEVQINMPSKEAFRFSDTVIVEHDEQETGNERNQTLEREISLIRERLRAIEADSSFLKHTTMTLQKGGEGTKILTEIAQHLRKLRHLGKKAPEHRDARSSA